jgi:hypothetical protein
VHFFTQVFQSSNKYVFVYQLNAGLNPVLTAGLNPSYIAKGGTANITGTLTSPSGLPISGENVTLEYSTNNKVSWTPIGIASVDATGSYVFNNWTVPSSPSNIVYVRAFFAGDPAKKFNLAYSPVQPLTEH